MKSVPDTTGRFRERPHYEPAELDRECESQITRFLRGLHGKVEFPISTDDLTKLIERDAEDLDLYADLASEYDGDVEGVTEFRPGRKPKVKIASTLSNDEARINRLRTTLTHEWGHVHFHTYLFEPTGSGALFGSPPNSAPSVQVCKRESIIDAPRQDWMEWQAGHVCGALLMPATYVRRLAQDLSRSAPPPPLGAVTPADPFGRALIERVRTEFLVSHDAARVRVLRLGLLTS